MTRDEVKENRIKWANFLLNKKRKKAISVLDKGDGARCCLGHGAYCLGVPRRKVNGLDNACFEYGDEDAAFSAPSELVDLVGLWDSDGMTEGEDLVINGLNFSSLASANDADRHYAFETGVESSEINITPQMIGTYLLTVIEGGDDTPFKPLSEYPEV
jgi:hypothetical protein